MRFATGQRNRRGGSGAVSSAPDARIARPGYRPVRRTQATPKTGLLPGHGLAFIAPEEREVYEQLLLRHRALVRRPPIARWRPSLPARRIRRDLKSSIRSRVQIKGHADGMSSVNRNLDLNASRRPTRAGAAGRLASLTDWISVVMTLLIVLASASSSVCSSTASSPPASSASRPWPSAWPRRT